MVASVEAVRASARQQADLFDHLASIAADGGELQGVYRALATHLRSTSDAFTVAQLTTDDPALRQDVLSIYLLNTAIRVGEYGYPRVGAILESIVRANQ